MQGSTIVQTLAITLFVVYLGYLFAEAARAKQNRKILKHVIYVNGTRGKSSVTRLINAGLRAGGEKVFCKTTGTLPMTIDTENVEALIKRGGKANIKEQLMVLKMAATQNAQILVAECMAVSPTLQYISQHRMICADIGVITNIRLDHTEEMGYSLDKICDSLCSTIPKNGIVFTTDKRYFNKIQSYAQQLGSKAILVPVENFEYSDIDFAENVAVALAVCSYLGVDEQLAISRMKSYKRDPYALSLHRFPSGALFINGLSINDPQSSSIVFEDVMSRLNYRPKNFILLINNRSDRGYRTEHMLLLAKLLKPKHVWLLGASQQIMRRRLSKIDPSLDVTLFSSASELIFSNLDKDTVIFAAGNIADQGHLLMNRIRKESSPYVS